MNSYKLRRTGWKKDSSFARIVNQFGNTVKEFEVLEKAEHYYRMNLLHDSEIQIRYSESNMLFGFGDWVRVVGLEKREIRDILAILNLSIGVEKKVYSWDVDVRFVGICPDAKKVFISDEGMSKNIKGLNRLIGARSVLRYSDLVL